MVVRSLRFELLSSAFIVRGSGDEHSMTVVVDNSMALSASRSILQLCGTRRWFVITSQV